MDNISSFLPPFFIAWFLSMMATLLMIRIAHRTGILDRPDTAPERKIHHRAIPLLGGVGIFLAFWITVGLWAWKSDLLSGFLQPKQLIALLVAGLIIMIGGVWDDRYALRARYQILFPILATLIIVAGGIGIEWITIPGVRTFDLDTWSTQVFTWNGVPYHIVWIADLVTVVWLLLMMYATKLSDSMDGLVSGISGIAALMIFFLSLTNEVEQPETAFLALMLVAACLGFLIFNWHPAMIFLGESGSVWLGFMLGVLSILAGSKIATTVLVMGVPLLDLIWVFLRRVFVERKSFAEADRKHFGHRLLAIGFTQRRAVVFLYALATMFGLGSLYLTRIQKVWALVALVAVMLLLGVWVVVRAKIRQLDEEAKIH